MSRRNKRNRLKADRVACALMGHPEAVMHEYMTQHERIDQSRVRYEWIKVRYCDKCMVRVVTHEETER